MADRTPSPEISMGHTMEEGGPTPEPGRHALATVSRSIARVVDFEPDPLEPDSVRATVSVICPDTPGMLAGVAGWLWNELDGNILSGFGGRMDGDIHGSFFTFRTRNKQQLDRIIKEVHMHHCDAVKPGDPPDRDDLRVYELAVTARDRPGIFCEVCGVLNDHHLNVPTQSVVTQEYPKGSGDHYAHIRLRVEVPPRMVPSLPRVIDEIRGLGRGEDGWLVTEREPDHNETFSLPQMMSQAQLN